MTEETGDSLRSQMLKLAPGQGSLACALWVQPDFIYCAYPEVYGGSELQCMLQPDDPDMMPFSKKCLWQMRAKDRRAACNATLMFTMLREKQVRQISGAAMLSLRKGTTGKLLHTTAEESLQPGFQDNMKEKNTGFSDLGNLRHSSAWREGKRKYAFALLKALGAPTVFITFSCDGYALAGAHARTE